MAEDVAPKAIADRNDVRSGLVCDLRQLMVIANQPTDLLSAELHLLEIVHGQLRQTRTSPIGGSRGRTMEEYTPSRPFATPMG